MQQFPSKNFKSFQVKVFSRRNSYYIRDSYLFSGCLQILFIFFSIQFKSCFFSQFNSIIIPPFQALLPIPHLSTHYTVFQENQMFPVRCQFEIALYKQMIISTGNVNLLSIPCKCCPRSRNQVHYSYWMHTCSCD